jgi:hypothetical protein
MTIDMLLILIFVVILVLCLIVQPEHSMIVVTVVGLFLLICREYSDPVLYEHFAENKEDGLPNKEGVLPNKETFDPERRLDQQELATVEPSKLDNSEAINDILAGSDENDEKDGDTKFLEKIQDLQGRSKEAVLNRSRFTSDNFREYYVEELAEQEDRVWWNNDDMDYLFVKDLN